MSDILYDCLIFSCEKVRNSAVIRLKSESFLFYSDVYKRNEFLDFLHDLEKKSDIRGVLVMNHEDQMDDKVVLDYVKSIFCEGNTGGMRASRISKMFNSLQQLVLTLCDYSKPVVSGMVGEVNYEFLSSSFPSDARIVSDNTRFINGALISGFPHIGTTPYFFGKFLGSLKAKHLLLDREEFSAQEALEMGFVTAVVEPGQVENACLDVLERYAERPADQVSVIRTLAGPCDEGLNEYMKNAQLQVLRFVYTNC